MQRPFSPIWSHAPRQIVNGIPLFGNEQHGDHFDASDVDSWRGGRLRDSWHSGVLLQNAASRKLIDSIAARGDPVIDLACGPGMGLIPAIKQLEPARPCLASDANILVLTEWQHYLQAHEPPTNLGFAQFSLLDMPFEDHSVQAYSSFIGLSSTRAGEAGYAQALAEVRRTLAPGGRLYAIENAWTDIPAIVSLFERAGMTPWDIFSQPHKTWQERFTQAGLCIVSEETYIRRSLGPEDNELGELAARFGVDVGMTFTAFIVEKD